jgi:epoxyqueuosine reductase
MAAPDNLAAPIKAEALRLGFSAAGIAPAGPASPAAVGACRRWLDAGMHGEMAYMARNAALREDPSGLLPGARSAVVVALNYHRPEAGSIASYARGTDYHDVVRARLERLLDFVRERRPEVNGRVCVDTAPILERDLAARAGLGWVGKNTSLITPGVGSWFFLGELLLDIEIPPDEPIPDHCGSCRRCLDACPTAAFAGPGVLDARRCISYLTIELKGPIPRQLRPQMGTLIFGCDICQAVCPHNKWQRATDDGDLLSGALPPSPDPAGLLALDEIGFRTRFRHTPLWRTKRRGLLRNACVALGNAGDPSAVPVLEQALQDVEPLVRGHAAWALGRLGGAGDALRARLAVEDDMWVREEIRLALTVPD